MSETLGASEPSREVSFTGWRVALIVALGFHLAWHLHGIRSGQFQNMDVAGIVYNARLLLAGRLPYVDSVEIKPPGAFLLFAPWLAIAGFRAVWVFSVFWGAATSLATGWLGAMCWGSKWGPRITLLHAAGAALAADGDINYSFWMTLPFVLSAAFVARARLAVDLRRAIPSYVWAAGMGTFAVLIRPSAATAALVFAAALVQEYRWRSWRGAVWGAVAGVVGTVVTTGLVLLPLVCSGNIQAMLRGYASVRHYANESISAIVVGAGGRLPATLDGLKCLPNQLPVFHLLLAVALLPISVRVSQRWFGNRLLAWTFALAALVGITLTLRFFSHDNAPLWAGLALLVMRPTSLIGVGVEKLSRFRYVASATATGIGLIATWSNWHSLTTLQNRLHANDAQVADLCSRIVPHLSPSDSVLAWGWSAWGVYEHCRRWAPGPVYKDLTTVTTPNTNTCNRGYEPPRLKRGGFGEQFLRDLELGSPGLILLSDYYRGMGNDPLNEWVEAQDFMRAHYVVYEQAGGFRALLRRDLSLRAGVSENPAPTFDSSADSTTVASANSCLWQKDAFH